MKVEEAFAKVEPPCCDSPGCADRKKHLRAFVLAVLDKAMDERGEGVLYNAAALRKELEELGR